LCVEPSFCVWFHVPYRLRLGFCTVHRKRRARGTRYGCLIWTTRKHYLSAFEKRYNHTARLGIERFNVQIICIADRGSVAPVASSRQEPHQKLQSSDRLRFRLGNCKVCLAHFCMIWFLFLCSSPTLLYMWELVLLQESRRRLQRTRCSLGCSTSRRRHSFPGKTHFWLRTTPAVCGQ